MAKFSEDFKSGYKDLVGCCFFSILRRAERRLSPQAVYSVLQPFFFIRATMNCAFRARGYATDRPDFLRVSDPARVEREQRMNNYSCHILEFFQDRLAGESWMSRCRIDGLEHLQAARCEGRPAVLAVCHFGPFYLAKYWLRAKGFAAAGLWGSKSEESSRLSRLKEKISLFPEIPLVFHNDQLRAADEFLAAGNTILVPIDGPLGKQIDVPFCDGWTFQMAAGAIRFAIRHQAALMPCFIVDEGGWRFSIRLGQPVPMELLAIRDDWLAAASFLVNEMMFVLRAHPEQCRPDFIRCLKRNQMPPANFRRSPSSSDDNPICAGLGFENKT